MLLIGMMMVWFLMAGYLSYQSYCTKMYIQRVKLLRTKVLIDDTKAYLDEMNDTGIIEKIEIKQKVELRPGFLPLCDWRPKACEHLNRTAIALKQWKQRRKKKNNLEKLENKNHKRPFCNDDNVPIRINLRGKHFTSWWGHVVPSMVESVELDCPVLCRAEIGKTSNNFDLVVDTLVPGKKNPSSLSAYWPKMGLLALENGGSGTHQPKSLAKVDMLSTWIRDSDVPINYMYAWQNLCAHLDLEDQHHDPLGDIESCMAPTPKIPDLTEKKIAAAFVSNCGANERKIFMQELFRILEKAGRPVDNWGNCMRTKGLPDIEMKAIPKGKFIRSKARPAPGSGADAQKGIRKIALLETTYKFAFAFENSIRNDYVTEKLLHPILASVIPVVWGAPEACDFTPGGRESCINALDYENPVELANYLLKLDKNPEEYLKYFRWRSDQGGSGPTSQFRQMQKHSFTMLGRNSWVCRMCIELKDEWC